MPGKSLKYWDVLIVDAGASSVGLQISRSLRSKGLRVCSIENDHKLNEKDFVSRIKDKAIECGVRMIIPVFNAEVLSRHRDEFPGIAIPFDAPEKLQLLDNKVSACELAGKLGILQPAAYATPECVEQYPVVFKRAGGHGGDSVYFPKFRKALENLVSTSKPGTYLITDEIEGDDVSVDALRWDGFFFAGAYEVILPKAKGISVLRESIDSPELFETARKIMDAVDFKGVCGFDFRREKGSGRYYFLECNPRFSGGLRSQTASGFDIPWLLWQLASGRKPSVPVFRSGVRTQYIKGTADYLKRRRRQGKLCLKDILHCLFSGARHFDEI